MEYYTRSYLQLIKPGITLSNTMMAGAGFLLATSIGGFSWLTALGVLGGVAFVIASACVVNNVIDRRRDAKMKRTRKREIASGKISIPAALIYAVVLALIGFGLLAAWTNGLTLVLGVIAFVWYVAIYGIAKRVTPLSTIIGAVCGALPPVAGYTAVIGHLDAIAWTLFGMMLIWQLPHFYAISVFRRDEYASAGLPVWSVRYGSASTKAQIFFWIVIFALLMPLLLLQHVVGLTYIVLTIGAATYWLFETARSYRRLDDVAWARRAFGISLVVLLTMTAAISIGGYLP